MTERDIIKLIQNDPWMIKILEIAESLHLHDWAIGAGFLRNKVWDYLHGYKKEKIDTADIDLVYYDPQGNHQKEDEELSEKLKNQTGIAWEVANEYYAHEWNNLPPYTSTTDALSKWPETATGIGVTIRDGQLVLIAPHGIDDLVNLIIRPTPLFLNNPDKIRERVKKKQWIEKWPKLKLLLD